MSRLIDADALMDEANSDGADDPMLNCYERKENEHV